MTRLFFVLLSLLFSLSSPATGKHSDFCYFGNATKGGLTVARTTRSGEIAIRTTRLDGSVIDISSTRVKEFVPNTHPKAPAGTLDKVKFDNALPGSKGYKRLPTAKELKSLNGGK